MDEKLRKEWDDFIKRTLESNSKEEAKEIIIEALLYARSRKASKETFDKIDCELKVKNG